MEEKILQVLDKQEDGFICPNQSEFYECDIHKLFESICCLIDKGVLRKRNCEGLAYEYAFKKYQTEFLVEQEKGLFCLTVEALNDKDAEQKGSKELLSRFPWFKNRQIKTYAVILV